jgi:zeaxanthin glucosyltransferase
MANILFVVFNEPGHIYPTLRLAKELRVRGHRVSYAGLAPPIGAPSFADELASHGFAFAPISSWFGGAVSELRQYGKANDRDVVLEWRRALDAFVPAALELGRNADRARPDICLIDSILSVLAPLFEAMNVPTMLVSTSLPLYRRRGLPPLDSRLEWGRSPWFRARSDLQWTMHAARRRLGDLRMRLAGKTSAYRLCAAAMHALMAVTALRRDDIAYDTMILPMLKRQTLVLAPRCFDFPGEPGRETFLGPALDLERAEIAFAWDWIDPDKRVVLCAFGSQTQLYRDLARFLQQLAGAFEDLPDHQLVIAAGAHAPELERVVRARNVLVVKRAPQVQLLARAALFITHCGLSSIKEAVWFGVPMLLCPMVNDQAGNAARIRYHGAGDFAPRASLDQTALRRAVLRLDRDPVIRERVASLQARFRLAEVELTKGIAVIESHMRC